MHINTTEIGQFIGATSVKPDHLERIAQRGREIAAKAMELTDSWEGVMFQLTQEELTRIALALGFNQATAEGIRDRICALAYATTLDAKSREAIATYHSLDVTFLALRDFANFDQALAPYNDDNVAWVLEAHQDKFQRIRESLPSHAARMNFKPETASAVLRAFGAQISADKLYELASKYGTSSVVDVEGRRGVSVEFIRSTTLTLASALTCTTKN
jgi:hypothetical protein